MCDEDKESRDTDQRHHGEDYDGDKTGSVDRRERIQAVRVGEVSLLQDVPGRHVGVCHVEN